MLPGETGYRSVAQLGISYEKDGSLSFDESKLREALDNDFDAVSRFLLGYEREGAQPGAPHTAGILTNLSLALNGLSTPLSKPLGNTIQNAMDGLNNSIRDMQISIENYELRLQAKEDALIAQFSAADQALRLLQVTMSSLNSSLAGLNSNR